MAERTTKYYDETAEEVRPAPRRRTEPRTCASPGEELAIPKAFFVDSILDVGCGTGRSLRWFAERKPGLELIGVDSSNGLLKIARERLPLARFEIGQGETLPLADGSVDLAMASGIMHHVDDPNRVIQELFGWRGRPC